MDITNYKSNLTNLNNEDTFFSNDFLKIKKLSENIFTFQVLDSSYREKIYDILKEHFSFLKESNLQFLDYKIERNDGKVERNNYSFQIQCDSMITLEEFLERKLKRLSYNDSLQLLIQIGSLVSNLNNNVFLGLPYLHINMISVIDDQFFFIHDFSELVEINKSNGFMEITKPLKKNIFFSRELSSIKTLPAYIPSNSLLFSLGTLVIYCLTNNKDIYLRSPKSYASIIDSIENTKLYYALLRCLNYDYRKRTLLIV